MFDGKPLAISCWRGTITVNLLTTKNETEQLLEKVGSLATTSEAKEEEPNQPEAKAD